MSMPQESRSPIRVQISDSMLADGIAVRIALRHSATDFYIGKISESGYMTFEPYDAVGGSDPGVTFSLNDDFARALLDALLRYYQGASDMHTVRSDLIKERERVDKLMSMYGMLAHEAIKGRD